MKTISNILGKKFGALTVIEWLGKQGAHYMWACRCDCGSYRDCLATNLKTGKTTQCEDCRSQIIGSWNASHGQARLRGGITQEYRAWQTMKRRCLNPNDKEFKNYGARGIQVCNEWKDSFEQFFDDMGTKPTPKHSLERKDVNGNYDPTNCVWATPIEQANNKRNNHVVRFGDKQWTIAQVARRTGIKYHTLLRRVFRFGDVIGEAHLKQ